MIEKFGKDGVIFLEEEKSTRIELKILEGMRFEKDFISLYFMINIKRVETTGKNSSLVSEKIKQIILLSMMLLILLMLICIS
jgi:chaperonin GroEL (HSP60 family)